MKQNIDPADFAVEPLLTFPTLEFTFVLYKIYNTL